MKIAAVILLSASLAANAKGYSQQITLSEKDAPLQEVFAKIEKQSGYTFAYTGSQLLKAKKVSIEITNASLEQVLKICFTDQPLLYTIIEKVIVVRPKQESQGTPAVTETISGIDISGRITDEQGNPLIGTNVKIKGINKSTITDANGFFKFTGIEEDAILEISYVGFEKITISFASFRAMKNTLALKRIESPLNEVQIIAYGSKSKRLQTGNVTSVTSKDIEKQPINNPLLALQGRVPGLTISQSTGFAGSGVKVRIQGENSIRSGNDPLYVIDGVPYISQLLPSESTTLGSSGGNLINNSVSFGNPLSFINPSDIESIEVLKDADATAIYGSRAANGAILITTKKGKAGEQKVEFNFQQGWGKVTRRLNLLDRRQYLDTRYEALRNDGIPLASLTTNSDYDLTVWDTTRYTDWQKELIGNTTHYTDLHATVSGGNSNTYYSIGAGYHRETTVLPGDFDDRKGSLHFQLNTTSTNRKFRLRLTNSYLLDINRLPNNVDGTDLTNMAMQLPPIAPALYKNDGSINWALNPAGNSTWDFPGNPMAILLNKYKGRTSNLISNLLLSYELIRGLSIKGSFGYTDLQTSETITRPLTSVMPEYVQVIPRAAAYTNNAINSWIVEPQISYQRKIAKGQLEILFGATMQQRNSKGQTISGFGYINDDVLEDIRAASSLRAVSSINYVYKYAALFGRINYNWSDKYIMNLTARRDGSSRFGTANQFHNFGSAGAAWIFTEENFIKGKIPFLSFGKLKVSYGTTGNDQIGDYSFLSIYNPVGSGNPYQGIPTIQPAGLTNPYLEWENTNKLSLGIELGFLNDRILANATYFKNRSSNQLLSYRLPYITGFGSITKNFPATVENSGWEFSLTTTNYQTKNFRWSTNINLTIPKNRLMSFPGIENSSYANVLVVGEPITIVKKFHFIGVDPATGAYYFDSKTNPFSPRIPEDASVVINTSPTLFGGIQNSLSYKGFQFDFLFQFVRQKGQNYYYGRFPGYTRLNQPVYILDRWQKPGDIASHTKYSTGVGSWATISESDAAYDDASYIRMKNISMSWQFPDKILKTMRLQMLRVFMQGQNLLTITNYKGLDPETVSSYSLPPLRVLTIGMQISF